MLSFASYEVKFHCNKKCAVLPVLKVAVALLAKSHSSLK